MDFRSRLRKGPIVAGLVVLHLAAVSGFELRKQYRHVERGDWKQRWQANRLSDEIIQRRELGPVAAWVAAIRRESPDDAVIGVKFPGDPVLASARVAQLRFLTWPRKILTPEEFLREIDGDAARLDGRFFGLQLVEETPPFAERWRVSARGRDWKLYQWVEQP